MMEGNSHEESEKWLELGNCLKLQHTEFADETHVRNERNRGFTDDYKVLNRRNELPKRKRGRNYC